MTFIPPPEYHWPESKSNAGAQRLQLASASEQADDPTQADGLGSADVTPVPCQATCETAPLDPTAL